MQALRALCERESCLECNYLGEAILKNYFKNIASVLFFFLIMIK